MKNYVLHKSISLVIYIRMYLIFFIQSAGKSVINYINIGVCTAEKLQEPNYIQVGVIITIIPVCNLLSVGNMFI